MDSAEFHKKNFDRITQEAGYMAKIILLKNGIQAKIKETKVVLTFYYRQKKYQINTSNHLADFKPGGEAKIISFYWRGKLQDGPAPERQPANVTELNDKGTQACIDHIERKIIAYQRVHLADEGEKDHATLAMLKSLKVEFEQYL